MHLYLVTSIFFEKKHEKILPEKERERENKQDVVLLLNESISFRNRNVLTEFASTSMRDMIR